MPNSELTSIHDEWPNPLIIDGAEWSASAPEQAKSRLIRPRVEGEFELMDEDSIQQRMEAIIEHKINAAE